MEKNDEGGFTLIEVLIVLGCLTLMLTILNTITGKMFETYEQKMYLTQLQKDIYYVQTYAFENTKFVTLRFMTTQNEYTAYTFSNQNIIKPQKAESIKFRAVDNVLVTYIPSGNIKGANTIHFTDKNGKKIYKLVFLLGRGRFYITEV